MMLWQQDFSASALEAPCRALVDAWRDPAKKVFVLRATQPIGSAESVRDLYESMFPNLGSPRAFAEDVRAGDRDHQRTGNVWMEVRYDPDYPDAYRHSANAQPLHTDGYIPTYSNSTLLACVANAGEGGETTFLDLPDLIGALESENPLLLRRLRHTEVPHARSGDRRESCIIEGKEASARIYWNYYCVAKDADAEARALAEEFHSFLASSPTVAERTLPVKLGPGDGVLWKDDELLHGRNSFKPTRTSDRFIWKCAFDVGVFA
jgi:alpha-ketoglutarate-dependent taurine dioxygenase